MTRLLRRAWTALRPYGPLPVARWYLCLVRANWRWRRDTGRSWSSLARFGIAETRRMGRGM
jgi:hypothetical protein